MEKLEKTSKIEFISGDNKDDWNTEPFRMFKGGSLWIPPTKNIYTAGMPDHVFEMSLNEDNTVENIGSNSSSSKKSSKNDRQAKKVEEVKKKNSGLSDSQRDRFEDMLRNLLPDRNPIGKSVFQYFADKKMMLRNSIF